MEAAPKLEQARYWWELTRSNANPGTIRGFIEASEPLRPEDGPEARRFLRMRQFFLRYLKEEARDLAKAVRRADRMGFKAPVYGVNGEMPLVRGDFLVAKQVLRWMCPHCGDEHSLRFANVYAEIVVTCPEDIAGHCHVRVKRIVPSFGLFRPVWPR